MALKRMDNVLIVVEDIEAAKAFFAELGMELEGETQVEGEFVDKTVGLEGVRADITMMRAPDGGRVELTRFHTPPAVRAEPENAPANALGIRRARRRDGAVRGLLPAVLHAWPRRHHHRAVRAAELNPARRFIPFSDRVQMWAPTRARPSATEACASRRSAWPS